MNGLIRARAPRSLGLSLAVAVLAGCGTSAPPPRPAPPAPAPVKAVEEEKEAAPVAIYVYSPVGKRDPFQNIFQVKAEIPQAKVVDTRPKGVLEKTPLDKLRLVLTMTGTASPVAVLETPDGRGWTVRIGTFVGPNSGRIYGIQREQLVVRELITDNATGQTFPSDIKIQIPKDATELADLQQLTETESLGAAQPTPGK
jgi:type IV pilus assembly protein PilP